MAAIDFPANPNNGQQFTASGVTWTFDGTKWTALGNNLGIPDAPADSQLYGRKNGSWSPASGSGGGISDAPSDGTTYSRKNGGWVHLTHTDITDWTATLAPYALASSVPVPGTLPPQMNGSASVGTSLMYSRGDHVHPTDTSRYSASNPAGYIADAPNDANTYARKGLAWAAIPIGIGEAPNDGWSYVRQNLDWQIAPTFQSMFVGGVGFGASPQFRVHVEAGYSYSHTISWGSARPQYSYDYSEYGHTFSINKQSNGSSIDIWSIDQNGANFTFYANPIVTPDATVSGGTSITLNKNAANVTNSIVGQSSNYNHWSLQLGNGDPASGSNNGSNFGLYSYNDSGVLLSNTGPVLGVTRASGYLTINGYGATIGAASTTTNAGNAILVLNGATAKSIGFNATRNGSTRWQLLLGNNTAEGGSNAGSDLSLSRFSDTGTVIDSPLTIARATGGANFSSSLGCVGTFFNYSGAIVCQAPSANSTAVMYLRQNTGADRGTFSWSAADGGVRITNSATGAYIIFTAANQTIASSPFGASGYLGRQGSSGSGWGSVHNWYWTSAAIQAWVDTTNVGTLAFTSDYRIKKDVEDLPSTWERVKELRPISYTHKDYHLTGARAIDPPFVASDDEERWGFIAHELQDTLIPSAATGTKDEENLLQSPNPWTVIATLTKALQEAMARIEALEGAA